MRLSRLIAIASLAVAIPLGALAAFTKPSQVIMDSLRDSGAQDFSAEAHVKFEEFYASAWLKGTVEGEEAEELKLQETMTIDVVHNGEEPFNLRIKAELRIVESMLYARLVGIEGSVTEDISALKEEIPVNKWYSATLDPREYDQAAPWLGDEELTKEQSEELARRLLDAMFTLSSRPSDTNTDYTLTLKRNFLSNIARAAAIFAEEENLSMPAGPLAEINDPAFKDIEKQLAGRFKMKIGVTLNAKDLAIETRVNGSMYLSDLKFRLGFSATSKPHRGAFAVSKPARSTSIEEYLELSATDSDSSASSDDIYGPSRARDAQRRSDVNTILNAIYQYAIDHNGNWPASLPSTMTPICRGKVRCHGVSLGVLIDTYLVTIPADPTAATATYAGYSIVLDPTNQRITVSAPAREGGIIEVTR